MAKKLKALAGAVADNQFAATVKESAHQIWLAGLGAFAKAQEEGNKVFDALVKEGESIQTKTRKVADEKIAEVAGRAAGTWDRLETVFEDRVARALGSLGVPTRKDVDKLSRRVAELTAAVAELTEGKGGAPVAKPVPSATRAAAAKKPAVVKAAPAAKKAPVAKKAAVVKKAPTAKKAAA